VSDDVDPSDTPLVRQVLYTNDVRRLIAGFVGSLFTVAEPARIRAALQAVLDNWPDHVERFEQLKRVAQRVTERQASVSKGPGN
jgi:hypothetical protein